MDCTPCRFGFGLFSTIVLVAAVLIAAPAANENEEAPMPRNPVVWWEINARDGKALTDFYEGVFEWSVRLDETSGIWHLDSGEAGAGTIGGGIFTGKGVLPPHRCLYVRVDDVDKVSSRVETRGCPILQGPFDLEGVGRLAFFQDPEGNMIGLIGPVAEVPEQD
jgi:predicted enzyme related to lactoylglutathione lyase